MQYYDEVKQQFNVLASEARMVVDCWECPSNPFAYPRN